MRFQAADERTKETAVREEEEQIARWAGTLKRVLDLRCEGVVDQAVWGEVSWVNWNCGGGGDARGRFDVAPLRVT